jgi:hypothetical protein
LKGFAWTALLLASCGTGPGSPTLAQRLQGNWSCHRIAPDGRFLRTDDATLAVHSTSLQYNWNISWSCDSAAPCPTSRGGYFEGIYADLGDSLALLDAVDTVAFRPRGDSLDFIVDGTAFPMGRR